MNSGFCITLLLQNLFYPCKSVISLKSVFFRKENTHKFLDHKIDFST